MRGRPGESWATPPRLLDSATVTDRPLGEPLAVGPVLRTLRRRAPEIVLGVAVLLTGLGVFALAGAALDDAAIARHRVVTTAEVLEGSTFARTLVRFTGPDGQQVVPERGVLHPRGLVPGTFVVVEYDATEPERVRVAGRSAADGLGPLALGAAVVWAVLGPLALWLRHRRARG